MGDFPVDYCDPSCWLARADEHPWSARAALDVIQAIDLARATGDRLFERKAQRRLAAEHRPISAWGMIHAPNVVTPVELRVRAERTTWVRDAPMTTLLDLDVTPVEGTWEELEERARDGATSPRLHLTLAELAPTDARARAAYARAAALSDDPVTDAYAVLHGEWRAWRLPAALVPARAALAGVDDAPSRLLEDVEHLLATALADTGALPPDDADEGLLRATIAAALSRPEGRVPLEAARQLVAADPTDARTPMLRWEIARATREPDDLAALFELSGPTSAWWTAADEEARAGAERLLAVARDRLGYRG